MVLIGIIYQSCPVFVLKTSFCLLRPLPADYELSGNYLAV
jgi:hypothetical protein